MKDYIVTQDMINYYVNKAHEERSKAMTTMFKNLIKTIGKPFTYITDLFSKQRQINELNRLTDSQLSDIGINRCDIHAVVFGKGFDAKTRMWVK